MSRMISISSLRKTYVMEGDIQIQALDGIDLEVEEGAFVVAMGPSGCGKSTLMHIIGGLDRPSSGVVEVGGVYISKLDEHQIAMYRRKFIGFVFQAFNLVPSMTAIENVSLPLRLNGVGKKERLQRAYELLVKVGMKDRVYHKPTQLSGGQQQRIAIARALANDPPVILADEPTGNLDSSSGEAIMEMLEELNRGGRTIFVVSHDPRSTTHASQIIKMLDGHIISQ